MNLIPILRFLPARCKTSHSRNMSSGPEKALGVFAIQKMKPVVNCNYSFGVSARGNHQFLGDITFFVNNDPGH
jgi:hypothetical protein